ncbi:hypothetical protein R3X27_16455 [Tropicimonas sp. TH_r6]|uniref:hypothetical protein n=1 Tax=Tropicimonas sp. TH_r6 TaxID=3082085 RepID=UPI0029537274|nr:hypothetical protein [Tropicimonas sp. TH_r6]MDV7144278.1 hypothetical protein [Tropicimonas sp. TH_r6]
MAAPDAPERDDADDPAVAAVMASGFGEGGNPEGGSGTGTGSGYGDGGNPDGGSGTGTGSGYGDGGNPDGGSGTGTGSGYGDGGNPDGGSGTGTGSGYGDGGNPDGGSGTGTGSGYGDGGNPDGGSGTGTGSGYGDGGNPDGGDGDGDGTGDGIGDGHGGDGNPDGGSGSGDGDGDGDGKAVAPNPVDVLLQDPETATYASDLYHFSIDDITVSFDGKTIGTNPDSLDLTTSKVVDGVTMNPIDSEFGFYVTDFIGAQDKVLDGVYEEGWAGMAADGTTLLVSNATTDKFSVPATLGTWLEGIGGSFVKASSEHYTVMQEILSDQAYPGDTSGYYQLDDDLRIIDYRTGADGMPVDETGAPSTSLVEDIMHNFYVKELVEALQEGAGLEAPVTLYKDFDRDGVDDAYYAFMDDIEIDGTLRNVVAVDIDMDGVADYWDGELNGFGTYGIADILKPNESSIIEDIAYGDDYSVTLKDDGKLLYRWGNAIKRPNDVRIDAKIELPDEWSDDANGDGLADLFIVSAAELVVNHTVTNNPNDQIRPEDFENEAAIGTLPTYEVNELGQWVSTDGYYAGDGTFYPAGTVLRDPALAELAMGNTSLAIGAVQEVADMTEEVRTVAYEAGHEFENPVAFALMSCCDVDPATVRFTDVSSVSASFFIEEVEGCDGTHDVSETVSLVTFEEGSWDLADGRIEVGTIETNMLAENGFASVTFEEAFDEAPSILLQVQTYNGEDWVVMRACNVTETGFDLAMQEIENQDLLVGTNVHVEEIIGWAAIDASTASGLVEFGDITAQVFETGEVVTHAPTEFTFDEAVGTNPLIAASITTYVGDNAISLKLSDMVVEDDTSIASFFLQEEQTWDDELAHVPENVTGIAFSDSGLLYAPDDGSLLSMIGAMSADLTDGFTSAWYTTMDRAPFTADINEETGEYDIGPRWRLQPTKYGQDLPSVVIPQDPSDAPPIQSGEAEYSLGADMTTVLNLLDWDGVSPLALSAGWMTDAGEVSDNGLNMTEDFDIAFYIKGDQKPVALYDAQLVMSYEEVEVHGAGVAIAGTAEADVLVGMGDNSFDLGAGDGFIDLAVFGYGATDVAGLGFNSVEGFALNEDFVGLIGFDLNPDNYNVHLTQEVTADDDLMLSYDDVHFATLLDVDEFLTSDDFYFA